MRKILILLLVALLLTGCSRSELASDQLHQWALSNGYILTSPPTMPTEPEPTEPEPEPDVVTSATVQQEGGVNYGAIEWDTDLQRAAVAEFLKGGKYLGSPAYSQDDTAYNYREMYQMATCIDGIPVNTNLELVLDAASMHLLGVSEAGTEKVLQFQENPNVSLAWCRQLHLEEEDAGYNYFGSYGLQYNGTVRIYTPDDLQTEAGQAALLNLFDKYYPTVASQWSAYVAAFSDALNLEEVREAKLSYITSLLEDGSLVFYEIIPTSIVITAPFLTNMAPSVSNAAKYTTAREKKDVYDYDLGLSDSFMDLLVAHKNEALATPEGKAAVEEYYSTGIFPSLDKLCAEAEVPTSLELALMENNAAGLKTQTTWIFS